MDGLNRIRKVLSSWYIRYLTATDLYMVEPWERIFIHVIFVIIFILFWHFNCKILVNAISQLQFSSSVEEIKS